MVKAWRKAHRFHPHRLRHLRATELRKRHGLDKTRAVLGHSSLDQAAQYAEMRRRKQALRETMMAEGGGAGGGGKDRVRRSWRTSLHVRPRK